MQVQSIFDHVILSTCYAGNFNTQRGKVKISHRFNQEGRIDFIELKFLYSLHPLLNGELRKLLTVKDYPSIQKDWYEAEAFVLRVLPQELVFLYEDILRCPRTQLFAWLLNIGHGIVDRPFAGLEFAQNGRTRSCGPRPQPGGQPAQPRLAVERLERKSIRFHFRKRPG